MAWRTSRIHEVVVYKSSSRSVWANLAFEDWILKNVDLSFRRILFLWRNYPCVVIGRHQNPWLECNAPLLRERGIQLARRRSGGGTVYHDLGNLNITVFSGRGDYDRPRNLQLVCSALNERWNTNLSVNKCNDIICKDTWKVSGSSSKLTKSSSYHHFTLLLSSDLTNLHNCLKPHHHLKITRSTATESRRSEVINLSSISPVISHDAVCSAIADKFYEVHGISEGGKIVSVDSTSEITLPGIRDMANELKKWEWNYGKTPKFTCSTEAKFHFGKLVATIEVNCGKIEHCNFAVNNSLLMGSNLKPSLEYLGSMLTGCRLWNSDIQSAAREVVLKSDPVTNEVFNLLKSLV